MNSKKRQQTQRKGDKKVKASRWRTYLLMSICGLTLVTGFFFAARQHFSSMDYGMKNSRLRRQIDELEAEKRRLLLAREISLSPTEIKKAVKKAGMAEATTNAAEMAQVVNSTKEKAVPANAPEMKPMIIKTSSVSPVRPVGPDPNLRTAKLTKPVKLTTSPE